MRSRASRGFSLIETMVSLAILSFGMVGIMQLQLISVRTNAQSRKMTQATALAKDLVENVGLWAYNDARLQTSDSVTTPNDDKVKDLLDLGREAEVSLPAAKRPHYAEGPGENARNASALRGSTRPYDGLSSDVDGDGTLDFERYWSVFNLDPNADGTEDGKLVVVSVRWREPGIGFRQISMSTFRYNAGGFAQ